MLSLEFTTILHYNNICINLDRWFSYRLVWWLKYWKNQRHFQIIKQVESLEQNFLLLLLYISWCIRWQMNLLLRIQTVPWKQSHGLHLFIFKCWITVNNLVLSTANTEIYLCSLPDLHSKQGSRANKIQSVFYRHW